MRTVFAVALVAAFLLLWLSPSVAQDTPPSGVKPDLPLAPTGTPTPPPDKDKEDDPPEATPEPDKDEEDPENPPPEFFDEPIESENVVFVVDRTGSMAWKSSLSVEGEDGKTVNNAKKIDVARIELIKCINDLSEDMKFGIVGYAYTGGDKISVWPSTKQIVPATPENKKKATMWAEIEFATHNAYGGTNIYDAMAAGIKLAGTGGGGPAAGPGPGKKKRTTIFLLTDGAPNYILGVCYWPSVKRVEECMELTKVKVTADNIERHIINTLGMGMDSAWSSNASSPLNDRCRKFLIELADMNDGHYREVSQ